MAPVSTGELGAKFAFYVLVGGGLAWLVGSSLMPLAVCAGLALSAKPLLKAVVG